VLTEAEGAHGKAWQRMAASSGAARSPGTGDRGRAGGMEASIAPALANGDLHGGEEKRGEW
jgi:hypothetical protein